MMEMVKKIELQRLMLAALLIMIGAVGRILLLPYPNIEAVMAVTLLAGCLLGGIFAIIVPCAVLLITDLYIGNNYIFLFTWSGFAMVGLIGHFLRGKTEASAKFVSMLTGIGIGATLLYGLWTNLGWWYLFYAHTVENLVLVYVLGIPFMLRHLLSSAIFVPLISAPLLYLWGRRSADITRTVKPAEKYVTAAAVLLLLILSFL